MSGPFRAEKTGIQRDFGFAQKNPDSAQYRGAAASIPKIQVNLVSGQIACFYEIQTAFLRRLLHEAASVHPCDASVRRVRIKLLDQYGMDMLRHQKIP